MEFFRKIREGLEARKDLEISKGVHLLPEQERALARLIAGMRIRVGALIGGSIFTALVTAAVITGKEKESAPAATQTDAAKMVPARSVETFLDYEKNRQLTGTIKAQGFPSEMNTALLKGAMESYEANFELVESITLLASTLRVAEGRYSLEEEGVLVSSIHAFFLAHAKPILYFSKPDLQQPAAAGMKPVYQRVPALGQRDFHVRNGEKPGSVVGAWYVRHHIAKYSQPAHFLYLPPFPGKENPMAEKEIIGGMLVAAGMAYVTLEPGEQQARSGLNLRNILAAQLPHMRPVWVQLRERFVTDPPLASEAELIEWLADSIRHHVPGAETVQVERLIFFTACLRVLPKKNEDEPRIQKARALMDSIKDTPHTFINLEGKVLED